MYIYVYKVLIFLFIYNSILFYMFYYSISYSVFALLFIMFQFAHLSLNL